MMAGVACGSGLWLIASEIGKDSGSLDALNSRLETLDRHGDGRTFQPIAGLPTPALIVETPDQGALEAGGLRLEGVSLRAGHAAALIGFGDGPARWLEVGDSRSGVTLKGVADHSVVVEGVAGDRNLPLGGVSEPSGIAPLTTTRASQNGP